jgi:hypothetical protein
MYQFRPKVPKMGPVKGSGRMRSCSSAAVDPGTRHARPKTEDASAQGIEPQADKWLGDDVSNLVFG